MTAETTNQDEMDGKRRHFGSLLAAKRGLAPILFI